MNPSSLAAPIGEIVWTNILLYIYCELGERVSNGFVEVYGVFCQYQWYLFPINVQRMLPNLLIIAQQPVALQGPGKSLCTRETFKKVCLKTNFLNYNLIIIRRLKRVYCYVNFFQVIDIGFTLFRFVMFCRLQDFN